MLRITRQSDYGLMLLCFFVRSRRLWTASELAKESHVPLSMVAKILKEFARKQILISYRGVSGGYTLERDPAEISVEEILIAVEGPIHMVQCVDPHGKCDMQCYCYAHTSWECLNRAIQKALRRLTLADMARPIRELPADAAECFDCLQ